MTRHSVKKGGITPSRPPPPFRPPDGPGDDAGLTLLRIPHSCSPPRPDIRMHIYLHYLQNCKKRLRRLQVGKEEPIWADVADLRDALDDAKRKLGGSGAERRGGEGG